MNVAYVFLIYVTLFRLSIICAGVISMMLGYRLFCKGVWPGGSGGGEASSVDATFAGTKFSLKNAAPGTCFGLFGVIIISMMFATGSPELKWEMLDNTNANKSAITGVDAGGTPGGDAGATATLSMRGGEDKSIEELMEELNQKGVEREKAGRKNEAINVYKKIIRLAGPSMNNLAWLHQERENYSEAAPLARVAVMMNRKEANFMDTLAVILCKDAKTNEAVKWMEKAAALDNGKYGGRVEKIKEGVCE